MYVCITEQNRIPAFCPTNAAFPHPPSLFSLFLVLTVYKVLEGTRCLEEAIPHILDLL